MNKELEVLVNKYKQSLDQLTEINAQVEKVNSSEQVIANHLSKNSPTPSLNETIEDPNNDKMNQILSKLKLDVDTLRNKRMTEVDSSKSAAQSFIDHTLWNLHSRSDLQNKQLVDNQSVHDQDKTCLIACIDTLITLDQSNQQQKKEEEETEFDIQLHAWLIHIITVYLKICTIPERKTILSYLTTTCNIASWAIPLIQFNDLDNIDDFVDILKMTLKKTAWTEDDYLAVLDQLAIDYMFNKLIIEAPIIEEKDTTSIIFLQSQRLVDTLLEGMNTLVDMNNLAKRISQTLIQMTTLLVETMSNERNTHDKMDEFISRLVSAFYQQKKTGWFFLPNIPYQALSTDALWSITLDLLQIEIPVKPTSLDHVLGDHLPAMSKFQRTLTENQMQGYFMLSCLTNIALSIPFGVDKATSNTNSTLSACMVILISHTLFTVAFVDQHLREVFYKDVRDQFGLICKHHPFTISLIFRWTVQHIAVMERMALYLFHSLDLYHWVILNDDLKLLHKLLSSCSPATNTPQQTAQLQLGKYVIDHLNYGYSTASTDAPSKSQPWQRRKSPFLSYEIHEEIAFILLDACQNRQPLPEAPTNENKGAIELVGTMTSAVSTYLPIADQMMLLKSTATTPNPVNDFIQWAWSAALRLLLYDCPVSSRATDIELSVTLPFLKLVLNSYNDASSSHSALLIYISFSLSVTSRHFLRFTSGNGWMKLLTMLKRGRPEAVIQIFSDMVPSFVYMHGDDFFNDETLVDFLKHLMDLKTDPMLVKAANELDKSCPLTTGIDIIVASHLWQAHFIDNVSQLMDEHGNGFSYVDLVLHSWLKTVFRKTDWMWHSGYTHLVDTLCRLAFTLHRHELVYHMLLEEQKQMEATKIQQGNSSPRLARFLKNMIPVPEGGYTTLIIGEWSMLNVKANTFNKAPGVENQSTWFAYEALMMETIVEHTLRDELKQLINKQSSTQLVHDQQQKKHQQEQWRSSLDINVLYKLTLPKKPIEYLVLYRWLQHILVLPVDHVLLPLYLQMFFSLYYQCMDTTQPIALGYLLFLHKKAEITKLRDYIANVQTFYGQKMSTASSGGTAEVLQQTYYAMWLWLGNEDLLLFNLEVSTLPSHYNTERLTLCYGNTEAEQPWHDHRYWMDLIDTEGLESEFLQHRWQGSEKFRTESKEQDKDTVTLFTMSSRKPMTGAILSLPDLTLHRPQDET